MTYFVIFSLLGMHIYRGYVRGKQKHHIIGKVKIKANGYLEKLKKCFDFVPIWRRVPDETSQCPDLQTFFHTKTDDVCSDVQGTRANGVVSILFLPYHRSFCSFPNWGKSEVSH